MSAQTSAVAAAGGPERRRPPSAWEASRHFLGNRFVYVTVCARAHGLMLGLNLNPDRACNFNCVYCEVDRSQPPLTPRLDVTVMGAELDRMLTLIASGELRQYRGFEDLNAELLRLRGVAFSGEGEPTICPCFIEAVEAVVHLRARKRHPFFKFILITNGTALHTPAVRQGLSSFTSEDEIWVKLDVGTQAAMDVVNQSQIPLTLVLDNIRQLGQKRPVIIQSLFLPAFAREASQELDAYLEQLKTLQRKGTQIAHVQVYSSRGGLGVSGPEQLSLKRLSQIAQRIRTETGLKAAAF